MKLGFLLTALVFVGGTAQAQTGDALLDRYSAAKARCELAYRQQLERYQQRDMRGSAGRRSMALIENQRRSCDQAADHAFERAQADQQRRGRR